jgi:hypothetical protein
VQRSGPPAAAVIAVLWSLGVAAQQEPQTPVPAPPAETAEAQPAEPGPEAQPQPPRQRSDESNDVFIPSEELSADEEVTFPVDI